MVIKEDPRLEGTPRGQGAEATRDRKLLATGTVGAVLAALCCMTPLLAVLFGAVGLTAWLAKADYVLIPTFILCVGLIGFALYRRRRRGAER